VSRSQVGRCGADILMVVVMFALVWVVAPGCAENQVPSPATAQEPTTQPPVTRPPVTQEPTTQPPPKPAEPTYATVTVEETFERLNANKDAQIVDVREPGEWATTGVPVGAVLIPLGELEDRARKELAKDKPVYVICNSGNRSRTGATILLKLGFTDVYNVEGGIQAWLRAGLPVESYQP